MSCVLKVSLPSIVSLEKVRTALAETSIGSSEVALEWQATVAVEEKTAPSDRLPSTPASFTEVTLSSCSAAGILFSELKAAAWCTFFVWLPPVYHQLRADSLPIFFAADVKPSVRTKRVALREVDPLETPKGFFSRHEWKTEAYFVIDLTNFGTLSARDFITSTLTLPPVSASTVTKTSAESRCPEKVERWSEFEEDVAGVQAVPAVTPPHRTAYEDDVAGFSGYGSLEAVAEFTILQSVFGLLRTVYRGTGVDLSHRNVAVPVIGQPDMVVSDGKSLLLPVEVKTGAVLADDVDLLAAEVTFQKLRDLSDHRYSMLTEAERANWRKAVENDNAAKCLLQIFGYACANRRRFAVITTMTSWWFLERPPNTPAVARIAGPYRIDRAASPTVVECLNYLVARARTDPTTASPADLPASKVRPTPPIRDKGTWPRKVLLGTNVDGYCAAVLDDDGQTAGMADADVSPPQEEYVSRAQVLRTVIKFREVALKIVDRSQMPQSATDELQNELAVYEHLQSLWGSVVPRLRAYGTLEGGMFAFIATDFFAGSHELGADDTYALPLVRSSLAKLHALGVLHGDLAPRNILVVPPGEDGVATVRFVDFAAAALLSPGDDRLVNESQSNVPSI